MYTFLAVKPREGSAEMSTNQIADEAAHVRRMAARIRRMLASAPEGIPRGRLRNRLNSREKYLFDTAIGLLVAVGDVETSPAAQGGTRYRQAVGEGRATPRNPHDLIPPGQSGSAPSGQEQRVGRASDREATNRNAHEGSHR